MSRVSKMSLNKILDITGLTLSETDIYYFCEDKGIIDGFIEVFRDKTKSIRKFLLEHETEIDKEKMVLCIYLNYKRNIEVIRNEIASLGKTPEELIKREKLAYQEKEQIKHIKDISQLGKDMEVYTVFTSNSNGEYDAKILASKELFQNRQIPEKKKIERWQEIDNELREDKKGSIYVIQTLLVSDLTALLPTEDVGMTIREVILNNAIIRNRNVTCRELENIRDNKPEEYMELIDSATREEYLPIFREEIIKNIRFIDIDKLLLMAAFRTEEALENGFIRKEEIHVLYSLLSYIKEKIEDKKVRFKEVLQEQKTYEPIEVEYSYKELENVIERFVAGNYITKSEVSESREKFLEGETTLEDFDLTFFNLFDISEDEIEKIMYNSNENFIFGIKALNLSESDIQIGLGTHPDLISLSFINHLYEDDSISMETIIYLYSNNLISAEFFKEFSEENDISSEINIEKINQLHTEIKSSKEAEEEKNKKLDTMIELYRITTLEEKDEDYRDVIEVVEEEEDILFYYDKGLLTLQTVADWSGESAISKLYNQSKITFEDIENLKMEPKSKQAVLGRIIVAEMEKYETAELLEYINKGYLTESDIFKIFEAAFLNDTYAENMLNRGIISVSTYIKIIDIGKEKLEREAKTRFSELTIMGEKSFSLNLTDEMEESDVSIGEIPDSKPKSISNNETSKKINKYPYESRKVQNLIDPNVRWAFLKALGCKIPKDKDSINNNPESPFYNYEFYVIEDRDSSDVQKDSIIIGERFFKDKLTEDEFATKNATYVWQYKDYLVAKRIIDTEQKRNKKAVLEETEGVIYLASHRPGGWAVNVLYAIAQAKAGESFKKYKKGDERATKVIEQLEKLYTQEELSKILDLVAIIDDRQEIIMPDGKKVGIVYEVSSYKSSAVSHDDDDDER